MENFPSSSSTPKIQESLTRLSSPIKFPSYAETFFGKENIKKLKEIFNNPQIKEIDELSLSGQLNKTEFLAYLTLLPEYHQARRDLFRLSCLIGNARDAKIHRTILESFSLDGDKYKLNPDPKKGFTSLIFNIIDLTDSLLVKNCPCRERLTHSFEEWVIGQIFTISIIKFLKNYQDYPPFIQQNFIKIFEKVDEAYLKILGQNHPGTILIKEFFSSHEVLNHNQSLFQNLIYSGESKNDYQKKFQELTTDNETKFSEITNLSPFRRILPFSKKINGCQIHFYGDEFRAKEKVHSEILTMGRLAFEEESPISTKITQESSGDTKIYVKTTGSSLDFLIDRSFNDLRFISCGIPLSYIIPPFAYEKLKNLTFGTLLDYLNAKNDDIDDPLISKTAPETKIIEIKKEEIEQIMQTIAEKEKSIFPQSPAIFKKTPQETIETPLIEKSPPPRIKTKNFSYNFCNKNLRGLTCKKFLDTLIRCGIKWESGHGSHRVLTGQNGQRCPMPYHPDNIIGLGLSKKILITLEITAEQLYKAL